MDPTPVLDKLMLESKETLINATVEIYNGFGKLIKSEVSKMNNTMEIDLQLMPAGHGHVVIKFSSGKIENHFFVKK